MTTKVYVYCIKTTILQLLPTRQPIDHEFRLPSSIRIPRLSGRIVCLPWGSDNRGSTVLSSLFFFHIFSVYVRYTDLERPSTLLTRNDFC